MGSRRTAIAVSLRVRRRPHRGDKPGEPHYRPNVWHHVDSSWIKALRFVPVSVGATRQVTGYVDMWVYWKGRKYRYGMQKLVYHHRFSDWIETASKGKFWWYRWTVEWSPAERIG